MRQGIRLKHLLILLTTVLLLLVNCSIVHGKTIKQKKTSQQQKTALIPLKGSEKVAELQSRVHDGLVSFSNQLFEPFVVRPERPYHLLLLFTTSESNCAACKQVAIEFELLGQSYQGAKQTVKAARDNNNHDDTNDDVEIFFGLVKFETNQQAFGMFEMTSAPHIMYIGPDRSIDSGNKISKKQIMELAKVYDIFTNGMEAENIAMFVKHQTGFEITIQRSKIHLYVVAILVLVATVLMAKLVLAHFDVVLTKLRRKQLWMTVSLLFYGLSVSGMVFCIIRNPPLFYVDRKGNALYFHPQGREQFVYEGLIIGAFDVGAALFLILLSQWAVYVRHPAVRYLAIVGCVLGFVVMYRLMTNAYKMKNPWYTGWMGI
ncbi:unnamed protein product [Peronospora belbahrii]|uniref:Magnesium transporter protein 1 n=1 Tax=Peronospora belbahrii TaxID=622444 RepID=A0AAU9L4Y2_9STRA|nr:unnamed protein product [Peronospora belbahrii]